MYHVIGLKRTRGIKNVSLKAAKYLWVSRSTGKSSKEILAGLSNNAFSFLNCNIRSIQANIDNLINMLSELYFPLSIIGLTKTKLKIDLEEIFNINIPSYNFLSRPSLSNAAGVGVFFKSGISHSCRQD